MCSKKELMCFLVLHLWYSNHLLNLSWNLWCSQRAGSTKIDAASTQDRRQGAGLGQRCQNADRGHTKGRPSWPGRCDAAAGGMSTTEPGEAPFSRHSLLVAEISLTGRIWEYCTSCHISCCLQWHSLTNFSGIWGFLKGEYLLKFPKFQQN